MTHDQSASCNIRPNRHVVGRWLFAALFAAVAVWSLCATAVSAVRSRADGWGTIAFLGFFGLAFATPFALAAYFCFKRRYRDLFMVGAGVAAFVVLGLGFTIPQELGVMDAVRNGQRYEPWWPLVMLALAFLLLAGPFYLAGWFLRACSRFASRRFPNGVTPVPSWNSPHAP